MYQDIYSASAHLLVAKYKVYFRDPDPYTKTHHNPLNFKLGFIENAFL